MLSESVNPGKHHGYPRSSTATFVTQPLVTDSDVAIAGSSSRKLSAQRIGNRFTDPLHFLYDIVSRAAQPLRGTCTIRCIFWMFSISRLILFKTRSHLLYTLFGYAADTVDSLGRGSRSVLIQLIENRRIRREDATCVRYASICSYLTNDRRTDAIGANTDQYLTAVIDCQEWGRWTYADPSSWC